MAERTTRGEEDRRQTDEQVNGEPPDAKRPGGAGAAPSTRDKGVEPSGNDRREGHGG